MAWVNYTAQGPREPSLKIVLLNILLLTALLYLIRCLT
jgi:hypothetical protein